MHLKRSFKSIAFGYMLYKEGNALPDIAYITEGYVTTNIAFGDVSMLEGFAEQVSLLGFTE